jgi:hypothetical protein
MSDAHVGAALAAISSAESTIADNDSTIKARSQRIIAILVLVVWGIAVIALFGWSIAAGLGRNEFVCDGPANPKLTVKCTNGWTETKDQLKDVFTYAVVPFVTLILGFYFGQSSKSADPV